MPGKKWIDDSVNRANKSFNKSEELCERLKKEYMMALDEIQKEASAFYMRYAQANGMTYSAAIQYLSKVELERYKNAIEKYSGIIDKDDVALMASLDAAAAKEKVTRLESLMISIRTELESLRITTENRLHKHLTDIFQENYWGAAAGLKDVLEIKSSFGKINPTLIEETIKFPWSGKDFSEIVWDNTEKLAKELKSELVQGFIKGTSAHKMSSNLAKKMGTAYSNAQRVVMTESAHALNKASLLAYADNGVKKVEFLAVLDGNTSAICFNLHGSPIKIEDAVPGKNIPPLHPHCRSTIVPVVEDEEDVEKTENSGKIEIGTRLSEFEVVIENHRQQITDISKHAEKQLAARKITKKDAQNYVHNALVSILQNKTKTIKYLSPEGTTILNANGKLVTAYSRDYFDEAENDLLKKMKG